MSLIRRMAAILAAAIIGLAGGLVVNVFAPSPAAAHGATMIPGSRQFLCWEHGLQQNGQILPTNPACADALAQSGTTPLYNWFGNLHSSNNGGTVGSIPDGRICDGGDGGPYDFRPYNAARNDWPYTRLTAGSTIQFRHNNWAHHPGRFDVYVTTQNWNPNTPLAWNELELIHTEVDPPQVGAPGGLGYYPFDVTLPSNRSGQHIIFVHWVRSDSPEDFFSCSDVRFDGGNGQVVIPGANGTPPPPPPPPPACPDEPASTPGPAIISGIAATSAVASWGASEGCVTAYELVNTAGGGQQVLAEVTGNPPATSVNLTGLSPDTAYAVAVRARNDNTGQVSSLTASAPFSTLEEGVEPPPPPPGDCTVEYEVTSDWGQGFQGEVTVTNDSAAAVSGWELAWTFPSGQQISQLWNGVSSQSGAEVTVTNAAWNGTLAANGGSATVGFLGNPGGGSAPAGFALNGNACTLA